MKDPENIHEIAIAKQYLDDLACTAAMYLEGISKLSDADFDSFENCKSFFYTNLKMLDEEPWANGKHCGDCTNVPCTCPRCAHEFYLEEAREEIRKYMEKTKWFKFRRRIWYFVGRILGVNKK